MVAKTMRVRARLARLDSPFHHLLAVLQLLHTDNNNSTYLMELLQILNVNCLE